MLNPVDGHRSNPFQVLGGDVQAEGLRKMELIASHPTKLQDDLKKLGLKIKHHENNLKFLKTRTDKLNESILNMQVSLEKYHSSNVAKASSQTIDGVNTEQNTMEQEKTAASTFCKVASFHGSQASSLTKDVLGAVATLGKVQDDNLSRLLSEYLGLETMLAIVCKTYEGVKALEKYDSDRIYQVAGIHGLGTSINRPINGRFLLICLEDLRPYIGDIVSEDPQKKLALLKPRLPNGECPSGFLGFAVNMINVECNNLSYVTTRGHGLRETLFYSLFSHVQVYRTRAEMRDAVPCISGGALSLDGGMMKSTGMFCFGNRKDVEVKFPVSSELLDLPRDIIEIEEQLRLTRWERERISEDMQRESAQLHHAKYVFSQKKKECLNFLRGSSPNVAKATRDVGEEEHSVELQIRDGLLVSLGHSMRREKVLLERIGALGIELASLKKQGLVYMRRKEGDADVAALKVSVAQARAELSARETAEAAQAQVWEGERLGLIAERDAALQRVSMLEQDHLSPLYLELGELRGTRKLLMSSLEDKDKRLAEVITEKDKRIAFLEETQRQFVFEKWSSYTSKLYTRPTISLAPAEAEVRGGDKQCQDRGSNLG